MCGIVGFASKKADYDKQAVLKEEFLNIQRHQDEMMELLNVGLDHPYHL